MKTNEMLAVIDREADLLEADNWHAAAAIMREAAAHLRERGEQLAWKDAALRKARLAMRAAIRRPPYVDLLPQAIAAIDKLLRDAPPQCSQEAWAAGTAAPRTCEICGLGPCQRMSPPATGAG